MRHRLHSYQQLEHSDCGIICVRMVARYWANLEEYFRDRTVVIAAHRLSTVSRADNILFMDSGRIVEQGTHEQLVALRGGYYRLVKNQLEVGR